MLSFLLHFTICHAFKTSGIETSVTCLNVTTWPLWEPVSTVVLTCCTWVKVQVNHLKTAWVEEKCALKKPTWFFWQLDNIVWHIMKTERTVYVYGSECRKFYYFCNRIISHESNKGKVILLEIKPLLAATTSDWTQMTLDDITYFGKLHVLWVDPTRFRDLHKQEHFRSNWPTFCNQIIYVI